MGFDKAFKGQPADPIEFLYRENFITLSSIGSIFTFALIASFREHVFDKLMGFILPMESFHFMNFVLPDIGISPPTQIMNPENPTDFIDNPSSTKNPNKVYFGVFLREALNGFLEGPDFAREIAAGLPHPDRDASELAVLAAAFQKLARSYPAVWASIPVEPERELPGAQYLANNL